MRILVCGGRDYADRRAVYRVLDAALRSGDVFIIEGGARGADRLAREWAIDRAVSYETFEADWGKYGGVAGTLRNTAMIDMGRPSMILAFPGGRGTQNMVSQGHKRGILVVKYPPTGENRLPFDLE
jgi:hypothetical protein